MAAQQLSGCFWLTVWLWSQWTNSCMLWRRKRPGKEVIKDGLRMPSRNDCQGSPNQPSLWEERWGQGACRARLPLEREDLSTPGCVPLKPLILCALSTPLSSCSSRAVAELATSNQAAACAVGRGSEPAPSPALLLAGCTWQGFRSSSQEGAEMPVAPRDICPHGRHTASAQLRLTAQHSRSLLLLCARFCV